MAFLKQVMRQSCRLAAVKELAAERHAGTPEPLNGLCARILNYVGAAARWHKWPEPYNFAHKTRDRCRTQKRCVLS